MPDTQRAEHRFTVKEYADGTPWITTEHYREDIFEGKILGLDLPKGTTIEKAKEIARYLNENISNLSITNL